MKRSGYSDLPLHGGRVPAWLADRMAHLGGAIIESVVYEFGKDEVLRRMADPFWFQSLGCVMGMDWHSSGITTSVIGALKKGLKSRSGDLGIYVCGGRGKHSRKTPEELLELSDRLSLDGTALVKASKLTAKVDNTAIQDGFQLYLHAFLVTDEGKWTVVQQGMNNASGYARRYHWHGPGLTSFIEEPHAAVCGLNQGLILNLTHHDAFNTRNQVLELGKEHPSRLLPEIKKLHLPRHHDVRLTDFDLKRLGSVVALAHEQGPSGFEDLLMIPGLGPRTLQSLTLVSEVIYGTPSRFRDPARYAFAHGGKDGHPFPVPLKVYDESIRILDQAVQKAKIGQSDKLKALKQLHDRSREIEKNFQPAPENYASFIQEEWDNKNRFGGRTVMDKADKESTPPNTQLRLF